MVLHANSPSDPENITIGSINITTGRTHLNEEGKEEKENSTVYLLVLVR